MATKKDSGTGRKRAGKKLPERATYSGLKVKQPAARQQTARVKSDAARQFAVDTEADVDLSTTIGSSQLSGEATRKLIERSRKPVSETTARNKAAKTTYGGRSVASVARIEKDAEGKPTGVARRRKK